MTETNGTPRVEVELDGRVATLTLSSPPANALGHELADALGSALDRVDDAGARVVVLRSGLPKMFAAGADLKLIMECDGPQMAAYVEELRAIIERIAASPRPVIAAIDGHALGGGLELALACHLRVASGGAHLGVPEIKLGLLPGAGGTQRLPRLIGRGAALDLLLTGRSVDGEEALRLGLVERLARDRSAADAAHQLAVELAVLPGPALAAAIECVGRALSPAPPEDGMDRERELLAELFAAPDAREGLAAFRERRAPRFAP